MILNKIRTYPNKQIKTFRENDKNLYVCNCCGRVVSKPIRSNHLVWCNKHYNQMKKYGKTLDNNPRTIYDKNEIIINGNISYIVIYDKDCNEKARAIIDTDDIDKVKNIKWKESHNYIINNNKSKGSTRYLHREILDANDFVDHINHNTFDNRKCNLRVVTKSQNQMNVNYKGINQRANGKWYSHIKINQKMINLGVYIDYEEALYARWYAEQLLFKEFKFPKEEPSILEIRKQEIQEYVNRKVQRL